MRGGGPRPYLSAAMVIGLLAVLGLLAVWQNRWITRLSDAERERLETGLAKAAERFCDDFDRELTRAHQVFRLPESVGGDQLEGVLARRLARWRASAPVPQLVKELLVVTRQGGSQASLNRFDESSGRLIRGDWGAGLDSVREIFAARGPVPILDERLPGLILPVREPQAPEGGDRRPPRDHVVVRLDREYIVGQVLPSLAAGVFSDREGLAYSVVVRLVDTPDAVMLAAGPPVTGDGRSPADVTRPLFSLRFFPDLSAGRESGDDTGRQPPRRGPDNRQDPRQPPPPRRDDRDGAQDDGAAVSPAPRRAGVEVGRWLLEVRHPAGSLEAVAAGARRRNLAISGAILALLGAVGLLLIGSTRRAQRLARQQMDFVASVSHELRTPLTAMRSAGQNLADGIVHDPERVRSYGALIEREGRRLTEMVARVLAFAGIRSGQQTYRMEPVAVRALIDGVLSDSRWILEEKRIEVETDVPEDVPAVQGDAAALRQALSNLLDNAMKYGGAARWVGVRAQAVATPRGGEVAIAVADRGPGIRRHDLDHLFEPFFRGGDARASATPGSGLGLAVVRGIVEAHGGRVTVETAPGRGSTFTLHLPAVPGGEASP